MCVVQMAGSECVDPAWAAGATRMLCVLLWRAGAVVVVAGAMVMVARAGAFA